MITRRQLRIAVLVVCLAVTFLTGSVRGHHLEVNKLVKQTEVKIKAVYSGGAPVSDGQVKVYNREGQLLRTGKADEDGQYTFELTPVAADLKVVVKDSTGHRGQVMVKREQQFADQSSSAGEIKAKTLDAKQLQAVVNKAVEEKLVPLEQELVELKQDSGPGITEIVGGLGYIFGLMGLGLYFKSGIKESD